MTKLKMGMVGGGIGAFIGAVHRMAAAMDNKIELVCGALSSTPEKSILSGKELGLQRVYGDYREMFEKEAGLPIDERMDFVTIVTPTGNHFDVIMEALKYDFAIVCDKPLCVTLQQANEIRDKVKSKKALFCLTHNYTGYSMVKEAKEIVVSGEIGEIIRVVVEYPQGWLMGADDPKSGWRMDSSKGISFTMADIGCHAANLAEYISGLKIDHVCADLQTVIAGTLDDDGSVLLKYNNGAKGILWASSVLPGELNGLNIRVYGDKGCIYWNQEDPNTLTIKYLSKPDEVKHTNDGTASCYANSYTRIPAGHPEGFIEAFANIYKDFANALTAKKNGQNYKYDFPDIDMAVHMVAFITTVLESNKSQSWKQITE